jgi:alpha-tubulin suppressor-like RCC1 family protein
MEKILRNFWLCGLLTTILLGCGSGGNDQKPQPVLDSGSPSWSQVRVSGAGIQGAYWNKFDPGYDHSCAIDTARALYCWGYNLYNQLGTGDQQDQASPTRVGRSKSWKSVSAGGRHTCAIKTNGTLWCWGYNRKGRLGDGTTADHKTPTQVGSEMDWDKVSAGGNHSCATKTTGTLWCWGNNWYGQLGDGTNTNRSSPVDVIGLSSGVTAIVAGNYHTCAIISGGSLKCWGLNGNGQLGDGTTIYRSSPVQIGSSSWSIVSMDTNNALAIGNICRRDRAVVRDH